MVQKVLRIVLVLLWTMPLFIAKHSMKTKYITKQQINYREEDEINHCHALNLNAMSIKLTRMVRLIYQDQSEILTFNIEHSRKMKSKDSYLNW